MGAQIPRSKWLAEIVNKTRYPYVHPGQLLGQDVECDCRLFHAWDGATLALPIVRDSTGMGIGVTASVPPALVLEMYGKGPGQARFGTRR